MAKKRGPGRPKKRAEDKLSAPLRFWVRDDEREQIEQAAKGAGQTPSAWMREVLVRAARRRLSR